MKKILINLVSIILFGVLYYSCTPEELPGSIYGTVVDKATGEPIKSAGVELSPSGLKTVTGSEGQFEFTELDPGKYTLLITKTGYIDGVSHTIEVKPGQQAKGDVQIEKLPPALKVVNDNREEISILDFGSAADDVSRSFSVFNDGTETLEWQITVTAEWIKSVSKTTGTLSAGGTQALIVTIDRSKLSSGENKTTAHITSNSGSKQLVIVATNDYQATTLNILPITDIKSTSAVLHGEIVEDGNPKYTERGFVYAETTQPTIANTIQKIAAPISGSQTFSTPIIDLTQDKKYYVRAYAIQAGKEVYSANEVSFTPTGSVLPQVTTKAITDISRSTGKVVAMGTVTEVGDPAYTERGFVYSTTHNPIIQTATKTVVEGSGVGEFVATLSNLQLGNTYYVRAYATNTVGTAYGEEQTLDFNPILPEVVTNDVTGISEETKSATVHATITNAGDPVYTERGFVYGKSPDPTTGGATKLVVAGSGTGTYYSDVHNLEVNCAYYVRAYVTYSSGTVYGENKMFSIKKIYPPTVTTAAVTNINKTTATAGGNVTDDGGVNVTERGVVYGTSQNPTVADNKVSSGSGKGVFTCNLTNLKETTTYYVRAYAINEKGTAYGEEVSFTTSKDILLPSVTTSTITQITETTAVAGGNVTSDGKANVTERGVVYSLSANPSISDLSSTIVRSGSGTGSFTCNLTGLEEGKKYYVRAYAMNSKGTAYGTEVTFTTNKQSGNGTENGYAYVDLGLSVKWATMNVGASKAEDYGDYFAWGEVEPKDDYDLGIYKWCNGSYNTFTKYCTDSYYGTVDNKTQLELSDDAARANWGGSWRMPTTEERQELINNCTWTWTTQNGVNGYKVTSKKNGNSIFLPAAGYRYDSSLYYAGSIGHYWSSSLSTYSPDYAYYLDFGSGYVDWRNGYRFVGFTVRPVCQ